MPRLIDADKVAEAIAWLDEYDFVIWHEVQECIDKLPTVDTEPVRHGRWKRSQFYKNIIFCDECGEPFELSNSTEHWNYCPNCGAKMDEEGEDDT